jgi:hypothetical protein
MCTATSWASSWCAPGNLDEHGVDAAPALHVLVAVEHVARGASIRLTSPSSIFSLSVILSSSSSAVRSATASTPLAATSCDQGLGLGLELVGAGHEVGLALQLDDGADVAVDHEAHDALVVLAVVALGDAARPFSRSHCLAASMSPSFSSSAFLQSIIPAPEASRSACTSLR